MICKATVEHYQEWNEEMVTDYMFVAADSIVKAVEHISNYFGENCLDGIQITPFSPDEFLVLDSKFKGVFDEFARHASDNVCW